MGSVVFTYRMAGFFIRKSNWMAFEFYMKAQKKNCPDQIFSQNLFEWARPPSFFYLHTQSGIHLKWRYKALRTHTGAHPYTNAHNIINYNLWISLWVSVACGRFCLCIFFSQYINIIHIMLATCTCLVVECLGIMKMDGVIKKEHGRRALSRCVHKRRPIYCAIFDFTT